MFNSNNGTQFTMPVVPQVAGNTNDGWGNNGGWFFWIIILVILFGWGGYGYGGYGNSGGNVQENYVLTTDFATIERKLDGVNNGLCDGFYAQAQLVNGLDKTINTTGFNILNAIQNNAIAAMQNQNALQTQIANCCCENKQALMQAEYNAQARNCATTNLINTTTRDIVDVENANTRAILDKLCQMEVNAKDDKIADLTAQVNALNLAASQQAQNNYLVEKLGIPTPIPAFQVAPPWGYTGCGCNTGCGC